MIANPARGPLNRDSCLPCHRSRLNIWPRTTGSAVPSRVNPLFSHTQAESGAYSWDSSRFPRRHPYTPPTAIGSVPSLSGHAIAYRWRSLPRVRRHKASSPQGSSSGFAACSKYHTMVQISRALLSHTHYWNTVCINSVICVIQDRTYLSRYDDWCKGRRSKRLRRNGIIDHATRTNSCRRAMNSVVLEIDEAEAPYLGCNTNRSQRQGRKKQLGLREGQRREH